MIDLGPFRLHEPVGRGGVGEVWRGEHRTEAIPVAVKVLTGKGARDPLVLSAFRNEVRAVAALDHPHVVRVFDHGEISDEAASASSGRLLAGSPYLVMEWASGGTLYSLVPQSFDDLRRVLAALLDALAHAHARGVIHRDLKPGNVLVCRDGDLRPGLKLADFGIARLREEEGLGDRIAGTAPYMAPEQFGGTFRDEGPWTDLYALGCVAYRIATGTSPFSRKTREEVLDAHLYDPVPKLKTHFPLPEAFEEWILRLLEKDAERRFRHAADAAWALSNIVDASEGTLRRSERPRESLLVGTEDLPTLAWKANEEPTIVDEKAVMLASTFGRRATERPRTPVPPLDAHWQRQTPSAPSMRLVGAGLGLYGLRPIPLVDREHERDRLWSSLVRTHLEKRASAIVLEGPSGCGKTRLANWLCERAREVGAATVLEAFHGSEGGPTDGLGPMLARNVRCSGLDRARTLARLERMLRAHAVRDIAEWVGLTELVVRADDDRAASAPVIRFASPRERYEAIRRHLARCCEERPVILLLDDVQWGSDALSFVLHLLDAQEAAPFPLLVIATASEEALAERPAEAALLSKLLARSECQRLRVEALNESDRPFLVRELLGLEGELAASVERRTAGNPLFAVQLVGDWVQRGVLEPGAKGFRLTEGVRVSLPDDMRQVWSARVSDLFEGRSESEASAIEIAALLGQIVDAGEWRTACGHAGLAVPWSLVDLLLDRHLARSSEEGPRAAWSFVHGMLRESLELRARESGRAVSHHRACAEMLRGLRGVGVSERLGRHLLEAGDRESALAPLLEGARQRFDAGEFALSSAVLAERDAAMRRLGIAESDARWAEGWVLRSMIDIERGEVDEAARWGARAEESARKHGWRAVLAPALLARSRASRRAGDLAGANDQAREAIACYSALEDPRGVPRALHTLGVVCLMRGELDAARESQERALEMYRRIGDEAGEADCMHESAILHQQLGDMTTAVSLSQRAGALYEKLGMRGGLANALVSQGEFAREQRDFGIAEDFYRRALAIQEALGSANAVISRLNLGLALEGRGHHAEASAVFLEALPVLEKSGWRTMIACVHAELLVCSAHARDWVSWDAHQAAVAHSCAETKIVDLDLANASSKAGALALESGETSRARAAYGLALSQFRALGRPDDEAVIEQLLRTLDR